MKNKIGGLLLGASIALTGPTSLKAEDISNTKDYTLQKISSLVDNDISKNINTELEKQFSNHNLTPEQKQLLKEITKDQSFKKELYEIILKEKNWEINNVVLSLILGLLYGFAYMKTVIRVRDEYMPIDIKSFGTFSLTSGGMVIVNGLVPGSIVYAESFLLAGFAVFLHLKNEKEGKIQDTLTMKDYINENPLPVVRYTKDGRPLIWNKKIEEETGYTFEDIDNYYNDNGEVMSLLYKGENLEKVEKYLEYIKETGVGYKDIAFTLTTRNGEEKTFLWTTIPDSKGGSIRTAVHLTNETEIKEELEKTQILLRTDLLTPTLNRRALEDDLHKMFTHHERLSDPKKITLVYLDIDNFKKFNDIYGHNAGDHVLVKLTNYIKENIRLEDRLYRLGGDEFVLLMDTPDSFDIMNKLNLIRKKFHSDNLKYENQDLPNIGTSWGVKTFDLNDYYKKDESIEETKEKIKYIKDEVDYYMYSVKYFNFIEEELIQDGILKGKIDPKNGIATPTFNKNGKFVGVNITNNHGCFIISKEQLDLIEQRKKQKEKQIGNRK